MAESTDAKEARKQRDLDQALLSKRQGIINENISDPKVKRVVGQLLLMSESDIGATLDVVKLCAEAELSQEEREQVLEAFALSSPGR